MLRQLASGRARTDVVGGKALMIARKVSPEVSLRPRKERIGSSIFYISSVPENSYG